MSAQFERDIGVDYSGAETAESSLMGLRVYEVKQDEEPHEAVHKFTRRLAIEHIGLGEESQNGSRPSFPPGRRAIVAEVPLPVTVAEHDAFGSPGILIGPDVLAGVSGALWVVMSTIGGVMLTACTDIANLLLVRADSRQQELAVRAALSAGSGRIVRELWSTACCSAFWAVLAERFFGSIPAVKYARKRGLVALRAGGRTASRGHHDQWPSCCALRAASVGRCGQNIVLTGRSPNM
jgi:hypothetical protein